MARTLLVIATGEGKAATLADVLGPVGDALALALTACVREMEPPGSWTRRRPRDSRDDGRLAGRRRATSCRQPGRNRHRRLSRRCGRTTADVDPRHDRRPHHVPCRRAAVRPRLGPSTPSTGAGVAPRATRSPTRSSVNSRTSPPSQMPSPRRTTVPWTWSDIRTAADARSGQRCARTPSVASSATRVLRRPPGSAITRPGSRPALADRLAAGDRDGALETFLAEVVGMTPADLAAYRANPVWPARAAAAGTILRELEAEAAPVASLDALGRRPPAGPPAPWLGEPAGLSGRDGRARRAARRRPRRRDRGRSARGPPHASGCVHIGRRGLSVMTDGTGRSRPGRCKTAAHAPGGYPLMMTQPPPAATRPYSPGLEGVIAGQTSLGYVDGERGRLLYRGYRIGDLVDHGTYAFGREPALDGRVGPHASAGDRPTSRRGVDGPAGAPDRHQADGCAPNRGLRVGRDAGPSLACHRRAGPRTDVLLAIGPRRICPYPGRPGPDRTGSRPEPGRRVPLPA